VRRPTDEKAVQDSPRPKTSVWNRGNSRSGPPVRARGMPACRHLVISGDMDRRAPGRGSTFPVSRPTTVSLAAWQTVGVTVLETFWPPRKIENHGSARGSYQECSRLQVPVDYSMSLRDAPRLANRTISRRRISRGREPVSCDVRIDRGPLDKSIPGMACLGPVPPSKAGRCWDAPTGGKLRLSWNRRLAPVEIGLSGRISLRATIRSVSICTAFQPAHPPMPASESTLYPRHLRPSRRRPGPNRHLKAARDRQ